MNYELIGQDEISALAHLPPEEAFVKFEGTCRKRLTMLLRELDQSDSGADMYVEYMGRVAAAAEEYQIPGSERLDVPTTDNFVFSDYRTFSGDVLKMVTKLQIRNSRAVHQGSVKLEFNDKERISLQVRQLRDRIEKSSLDETQKKSLLKKLDALDHELKDTRFSLTRAMICLTAFFASISQAESVAIKAPEALAAIMQIVGAARGAEGHPALPAPESVLAIEDKREKVEKHEGKQQKKQNLDEEIPF